jgi:cytochrome P450 PksS
MGAIGLSAAIRGHETITHLISGSVYELLRNPARCDWLEEDWSRAGLAVEEFLTVHFGE